MSTVQHILKRMKQLQISTKQIARYCMRPEDEVKEWLAGTKPLLYKHVWLICDLLSIDPSDILTTHLKKRKKRR